MPDPKDIDWCKQLDAQARENQKILRQWAPDAVRLKDLYADSLFIPKIDAPDPEEDEWE